jgi:tetratricopeptide (TPR) repeat protein
LTAPSGAPDPALPSIRETWDFGDPASSEVRFRELAVRADAAGDASYALEARTQVARALGLQRRFDEGHAELDAAGPADTGAAGVRVLLERGRLINSSGDPAGARPSFEAAWELARAVQNDDLAVDAAHMVAIVTTGAERRAWNERAIDLAEGSRDPDARRWRASLLNNQGWDAYDDGDYERALALFERALEARLEMGAGEKSVRTARWCVAKGLRAVGRVEEALTAQRELAAGDDDDGYVSEELGECLLALGRPDEARPHFAAAYRLLAADDWFADAQPDRLARLAKLGA